MKGKADGFKRPEGSKSRIVLVRRGSFPGVVGSATVSNGNVRNLGDPCRLAKAIGRNDRRGRKSDGGEGVGLPHSSEEVSNDHGAKGAKVLSRGEEKHFPA